MSIPSPSYLDDNVDYPTGDGRPVGETEIHRDNLLETIWMLQQWYEDRDDVYVSGNMFVYYVPGDRYCCLCPDVFVAHGVPKTVRDSYKTWEEPKPELDLVIEFTSRSTKEEDLDDKFDLYRDRLGVTEYLLFDPYSEYLDPPQQLFRRSAKDEFEPVKPIDGRLPSEVLGLHFERDDRRLRLWIPETGQWILTPKETHAAWRKERETARRERKALRKEQNENQRLRDELADLKRRIADVDENGSD